MLVFLQGMLTYCLWKLGELLHKGCVKAQRYLVVRAGGSTQGGRQYSACTETVHASLDAHKSSRCW